MKSLALIILSFAMLSMAHAQKSKLKIKGGTRMGFDSNIFLSPTEYETKNDDTLGIDSLYENGAFNYSHLDVKYDWTAKKKKDYFHTAIKADAKNYLEGDLSDFYGLTYFSTTSFKHKYQRYSWIEPELKTGRQRLVRTTIIGDEYTRPYSFYQFYPKVTVQQRLFKNAWLQGWTGYDMRTYDGRDTISNFQSFSYNSVDYGAKFSYRHKLFKKLMKYELSWTHRDRRYTEWLIDEVFDDNGYEIPLDTLVAQDSGYVYPLNNWVYDIFKFKIEYPISKRFKLTAYYSINHKADRGEGDLGFTTPSYGGKLSYKKGKFVASYKYAWLSRNYHNRLAYTNNDEPEAFLYYRFMRHDLYMSYTLGNKFRANLTISAEDRFTNSTDISKKFRRSYFTYGTMLGVSYTFSKKWKKKKTKASAR